MERNGAGMELEWSWNETGNGAGMELEWSWNGAGKGRSEPFAAEEVFSGVRASILLFQTVASAAQQQSTAKSY